MIGSVQHTRGGLLKYRPLHVAAAVRRHLASSPSAPSFDLPKIRDEILQNWLQSEAQNSISTERAAQYCKFTYYDGERLYKKPNAYWHWLDRELSSNVAGETGAVYIYKGALAALTFRPNLSTRSFAEEHMKNEDAHLRLFEAVLPDNKYTMLLPIWRLAGWTLGFLATAVGGSKGLYVTVEAVETFVEEHYQAQIVPLRRAGTSKELIRMLEFCCEDEVHHKEDAAQKLLGPDRKEFHAWWVDPWSRLVKTGSTLAAEIARRV